ncbi:g3958 [Coccomyxa elongata]
MGAPNTSRKGIQKFVVPPERYISTPTDILVDDLVASITKRKGTHEKDTVLKVARLIESISQFEFTNVRRRISQNFLTFASGAPGKPIPVHTGTEPSEEELDDMEMAFLEDMYELMQASHFRLLSEEDWDTAQDEQFTFNSPVEVNWDYMDGELLQRFWAGRSAERAGASPIADRILVFHRGISTVKAEGQYINDKIDLLVQYLLVDPFQSLYSRIFKHKAKLHVALELGDSTGDKGFSLVGQGPPATGEKPDNSIELSRSVPAAPLMQPSIPAKNTTIATEEDVRLHHSAAQTVVRQSLRRLMPDAAAVLRNMFATLQIQEPAFKNVVVLYRRKVATSPQRKSEYEPIRNHNLALERRNINIKRFAEIPMADAEMVFPDKKIYLKPLLLIQLAIAIIGGIIATFTALLSGKLSGQLLLSVLSVVGGRAMQVWTSANFARARVVDQVTQQLYEQTMDTQEGVVYLLLEEMAQQRIKEYLLAYALLLLKGRALTQQELDEECEAHLQQRYGESLDFAIENSLPFLLRDGLITRNAQGGLEAAALNVACTRLGQKWDGFFEQQDEDREDTESEADRSDAVPAARKGRKKRSIISKLFHPTSSSAPKQAEGQAPVIGSPVHTSAAPMLSEPVSTAVDKRSGIITVETPDASSLTHRTAADGSTAAAVEEVEDEEEGSGDSKRKKMKEGLASLFGKGPKKDQ